MVAKLDILKGDEMKKRILWLGLSFLLVATLVLASCGPTVPEGEEEEEEEEVAILSIGETYQTPEVAVTISEAMVIDSYEYIDKATGKMSTLEAEPGKSLLIFTVEIKNVGDTVLKEQGVKLIAPYDSEGSLHVSGGGGYSPKSYPGEDALPVSKYISPGDKIEGKVLSPIPEGASGLKIAYLKLEQWDVLIPIAMWEIE